MESIPQSKEYPVDWLVLMLALFVGFLLGILASGAMDAFWSAHGL